MVNPLTYKLSSCGQYYEMLPEVETQYLKSLQDQLDKWVNGENVHTTNLPEGIEPECTPDFACCTPTGAWSKSIRETFVQADQETRTQMLMQSVASLIVDSSIKTHIVGLPSKDCLH